MTDTAAPPTLVFRRRSTLERLALDPDLEIGAGGEAVVYGVPGDASLVAKIYHDPTVERARKLGTMLSNPPAMPEGTAIAWPADLLLDGRGRFAGFVMPRAEGPRLFEFYNPVSRRATAPGFHAGLLHRAGRNLAAAFDALHAAGYVVGDVNESNLLVAPDADVTLVDADSLQVRDAEGGGAFRSRVGKAEFTPPELQGVSFGEVDRAPEHDRFGLAVLLFLLLMEGTHPFAARFEGEGEVLPVEERIRRRLYPYAALDDDCRPPRLAPPIETLDPGLQALFARCFVDGHADPAARPSAAEWRDALAAAEAGLRACDANPQHRFAAHVPFCPWCHRRRLLQGRDPFPASVELARATAGARVAVRRRSRVEVPPPAAAAAPAPAHRVSILPQPVAVAPPSGFLGTLQAALPPSLAGPAALGNPVPWIVPSALTVFYASRGELRILALAAGFVALRSLFRSGLAGFTARTAGWVVALLLLWFVFSSSAGASHAVDVDDDYQTVDMVDVEPAPPDPPIRPDAFDQSDVDTAPVLLNQDDVAGAMVDELDTRRYPAPGEGRRVTMRFVVNEEGTVDIWTADAWDAPSPYLAQAAIEVARSMRFEPGVKHGRPVAVWTDYTLTFPERRP